MGDSHIIFPSMPHSVSQTGHISDVIEGNLLGEPYWCQKLNHEKEQAVKHITDEVKGNLLSGPSNSRKVKDEKDNIKIKGRYSSHLLRRSNESYRLIKNFQHHRNQMKEIDDSHKQHKEKAQKRYSLFIDRYVGTIKARSFDFSNVEHIYIKSSILDPIITLKEELGLGPKTIVSIIKVDYEKILPGLPSMLNNVTTVIIAKSANIHKNHEPENDTVRTKYDIIDLETGSLIEQNNCDSIKIPYSNDMNNFNKDFVCKVLKSFDNNTGYLLSKTYSVCNCSNLELIHDNSSNNYQSNAQSVPRETPSAKDTMDCLPNTRINDSKFKLKYEENVPMVFIKDINPDFVEKQEFVDYEDLYKKVPSQSTSRVKPIDYISVSEPCGQNLTSPTVIMKYTCLGSSNGSNNMHETSIKNKLKRGIKEKSSEPHKYKKNANKQADTIKSEQSLFVDYEDLYKKVTNQLKSRVKPIHYISVSEPSPTVQMKYTSPTVLMKYTCLGSSNGSNNIHETLIKNKLKRGIKEKSSEPHKYKKLAYKQENTIKSEQCISIFTQPKSSEKCTDSAYLKKTNTLPGKLTKCKAQKGSNIKTAKKNKKRKKTNGNNQLNIEQEVSEQVSNTNKIPKNRTFKSPWYTTIAYCERVVKYISLMKGKPLSIKSESSELGNNPTSNTGKDWHSSPTVLKNDKCLGSSNESNNIHETLTKNKLKGGKKEKSNDPHKYKKIANKQANSIKSEQCISIFTQPKSSEKCTQSAYLKKTNTLPGKLNKCKSQIGYNIKTAKKSKKKKKTSIDNQLNIKPEVSERVTDTNKIPQNRTLTSPWYKTNALRVRVVKYVPLMETKPFSIKSELSEIGNNPTKNIAEDRHSGSSKDVIVLHEKNVMYKSLIKEEQLNIKPEQSESGTNPTNITANGTHSGSSKGDIALHERIFNYKPLMEEEQFNIKSERSEPDTNTSNNIAKSKHLGSSSGAVALCQRITKYESLIKQEENAYTPSSLHTGLDLIKEVYADEETAYNPCSLHAGLDTIGGKKNSVSISDNLSIETQNNTLHCFLYNSIIESNNCQLDYVVVKNCDAILKPLFPNGDCTLLIKSMNGYMSIIVSRYKDVCVNGTTVPCSSINMPMDICFDGILKRDGTVKTILVMWVGIKPDFFDSYRLINGNPETIDFMDCKGICSRIGEKMIIKTHIGNTNLTLKCLDSIISGEILNINKNFTIPNDVNVSLYIRRRNQHNNKPIWTITWMILHLSFFL